MSLTLIFSFRRFKAKLFNLLIAGSFASFGTKASLHPSTRLRNTKGIKIGDSVFLGPNSWLEVLDGTVNTVAIEIGSGTSISGACTITAAKSVIIEPDVIIGQFVHISDHSHAYKDPRIPIIRQGVTKPRPVRIGTGTWICQSVVICPGTIVGKNCVIAANTVAKGIIPDRTLVVGSPARHIKIESDNA